jgi:hypothetical protein
VTAGAVTKLEEPSSSADINKTIDLKTDFLFMALPSFASSYSTRTMDDITAIEL